MIDDKTMLCSACEGKLTSEDLEGLCLGCYKKARGTPTPFRLTPENAFMMGMGHAIAEFLTGFLTHLGHLPCSSDAEERERQFDAWCERIGMTSGEEKT